MKKIEGALSREGYHVLNVGYPSRDKTIEEHAKDLEPLVRSVPKGNVIHFVGFSLGSQVIRYYLNHFPVSRPGRFVMIAPPNHGSELADYFYRFEWFPWLYGTESGPQLKASNRKFFESLGEPPLPFGIIAGGRGNKTGRSPFL
ncbi:MAG TPA: alpha/beta fold hydrolase, partial [Nitrospiria bacterium]